MILVVCVDGAEVDRFLGLPATWDKRTLPLLLNSLGFAERSLAEVDCREAAVAWSLPGGVRSAKWCMNYLLQEGLGFEAHHERIRSLLKLEANSWGVADHLQMSLLL